MYVPIAQEGLGLRSIVDEIKDMITNTVKMLTSLNPLVQGVAQHSLECTIHKRFGGMKISGGFFWQVS